MRSCCCCRWTRTCDGEGRAALLEQLEGCWHQQTCWNAARVLEDERIRSNLARAGGEPRPDSRAPAPSHLCRHDAYCDVQKDASAVEACSPQLPVQQHQPFRQEGDSRPRSDGAGFDASPPALPVRRSSVPRAFLQPLRRLISGGHWGKSSSRNGPLSVYVRQLAPTAIVGWGGGGLEPPPPKTGGQASVSCITKFIQHKE